LTRGRSDSAVRITMPGFISWTTWTGKCSHANSPLGWNSRPPGGACAEFRRILRPNTFLNRKSVLCRHILFASMKSCTDLDPTLLYILILRTHAKCVYKNKMLALGICSSQPCSSAGRRFAASRSCLNYYGPLRLFPHRQIRWITL